jgi:hypothetical protein
MARSRVHSSGTRQIALGRHFAKALVSRLTSWTLQWTNKDGSARSGLAGQARQIPSHNQAVNAPRAARPSMPRGACLLQLIVASSPMTFGTPNRRAATSCLPIPSHGRQVRLAAGSFPQRAEQTRGPLSAGGSIGSGHWPRSDSVLHNHEPGQRQSVSQVLGADPGEEDFRVARHLSIGRRSDCLG